jgi:Ser/Thr protein kinase RdoA (MazF antagonist)
MSLDAAAALLHTVAARFATGGGIATVEPFSGPAGHINASYVVRSPRGRFFLQRLNTDVFRDHQRLMENVARVTEHLAGPLRLVPAQGGAWYVADDQGGVWRMYAYIENGTPVVGPPSGRDVGRAAGAFGAFQRALADLPGPRLHETIPHFHDTPRRLETLERAVESDTAARAASVRAEIDRIRGCRHLAPLLVDAAARGAVPERVVHNDAKLANVLFDRASGGGEALCVVDLDTVMPGLALYDFGDLVRSMATRAAEDERDLGRVRLEPELFESVACGYIDATRELLTQAERELLVPAAQVIVFEQAVRFLIDHLEGDRYYRIARPGHNLDRCRTQLALLDALRAAERALQQTVARM